MNCIRTFTSYMKNKYYCNECHRIGHASNNCVIITRRKAAFIILIRVYIEQFTSEEELSSFLHAIPRMNLDIIASNYLLPVVDDTDDMISTVVTYLSTIQLSGSILASNRIKRLRAEHPQLSLVEIIPIKLREVYTSGVLANLNINGLLNNIRSYIYNELYTNQPPHIKEELRLGCHRFINELLQNPSFIEPIPSAPPLKEYPFEIILDKPETGKFQECCICFDSKSASNFVTTNCNHEYCSSCMKIHIQNYRNHSCPICRETIHTLTSVA